MTTSTTQDFADTSERAHYRKLLEQFRILMSKEFYWKIKDEHLDAVKFYRNEQIQDVLKYADEDKA